MVDQYGSDGAFGCEADESWSDEIGTPEHNEIRSADSLPLTQRRKTDFREAIDDACLKTCPTLGKSRCPGGSLVSRWSLESAKIPDPVEVLQESSLKANVRSGNSGTFHRTDRWRTTCFPKLLKRQAIQRTSSGVCSARRNVRE